MTKEDKMVVLMVLPMILIGSYLHDDRMDVELPAVYHYLSS